MLRPATEHDLQEIRALIQSAPGLWHEEWRPEALDLALQSANGLAFVWEEAGEILGFSCTHDVGFLAYLSLLVVAEGARGRGIGRALLERTEHELRERGCATLISDVWEDAVEFYRRLGWSPPGAVLLRKRIAKPEGQ
jgi:GNAT superfamily N-acetyltransferase